MKLRRMPPEAVKAKGRGQIERKKAGEQDLVPDRRPSLKPRQVSPCGLLREHEPQDSSLTTLLDLLEILSACGAFCHNGI